MKKLSAILLTLALCLSMASCGAAKSDDDNTSSDVSSVESVESVASEETTLESYVNTEEFQSQIESMSASYESQGIKLEVKAEGNTLVYTCQYTVDVDVEATKAGLDAILEGESMTSAFESVLTSVRAVVPEAESVVVKYTDKDGNVISSKEYK